MIAMCLGGAFYGYVIGNISTLMAKEDYNKMMHHNKMQSVRAYVKLRKFPRKMSRQIYSYFDFYYASKGALDEQEILNTLTGPLRDTVTGFLVSDTLGKLPMFQACVCVQGRPAPLVCSRIQCICARPRRQPQPPAPFKSTLDHCCMA